MFTTKDELMSHRKVQHWKTKLCPYYHGTGRGCRFPDRVCLNIHRFEEQQQNQGDRRQVQGASSSSLQDIRSQEQMTGDRTGQEASWARVAGGQGWFQGAGQGVSGHGNHGQRGHGQVGQDQGVQGQGSQGQGVQGHGVQGQVQTTRPYDARVNIDCRDGLACRYYNQGICRYRHIQNQTNQNHNQTNQNHNQINQNNNQTNQNNYQTNQIHNQAKQPQENHTNETSFNMQEMKATLDNLVKVVYNLKSLSDFPKVGQSTSTQ